MDLQYHLHLAGQNLLGCLCSESNLLPYWHMAVDDQARAEYQFRPHCTGHNVGRWWNAVLRLQASTGFHVPEATESAMLGNTWRLCDNPTGILLDEPDPSDVETWYIHSYRETMLALGLLVKHRQSERARQQGLRAIARMNRASTDLMQWNLGGCSSDLPDLCPQGHGAEPAYTHGRAIEGLLCFHQASGAPEALVEAQRLADFHMAHTVCGDGSLAPGAGHHTHSYLNTIRGLLLMASRTGRQDHLDALLATYHQAIATMITGSGFVTHDVGAELGGDIASAGDIAHIALLFWDHFQDPGLLDDVEKIVRCRLLPAQVCQPMSLEPQEADGRDCHQDLPRRFVGAIGGSVGHVRGQTCVTDFTAAALHSLVEVYDRIIDIGPDTVRVNFHFSCSRAGVRVESVRQGTVARVTVHNSTGKATHIRVPGWAPVSSVQLTVDGRPCDASVQLSVDGSHSCDSTQLAADGGASHDPAQLAVDGGSADASVRHGYVLVPARDAAVEIELEYALPEYTTEEPWCDEWATQDMVTFSWRGDSICGVEPVGEYLRAYPKHCVSLGG
jgi:hypothetical protein